MPDGFHHAAIAVSDIPRAVSFYEGVLDCRPVGPDDPANDRETAQYFWLAVSEESWLNLADRPSAIPEGTGAMDDPHVAFAVEEDELATIRERLDERGIESQQTETSLYFRDPDGNYLEATHFDGPER